MRKPNTTQNRFSDLMEESESDEEEECQEPYYETWGGSGQGVSRDVLGIPPGGVEKGLECI